MLRWRKIRKRLPDQNRRTNQIRKCAGGRHIPSKYDNVLNLTFWHFACQISEICWGQNTTSLTRKQFFSALKLVAAYQANIPIQSEIVTSNLELPLPRFTWNNLENEAQIPDLIELRNDANDYVEQVDANSTDSEVDSDTLSIVRNGSPEISSTASDSPTPTNSVQDRSWAVGGAWQGLVSEEQRQLLGKSIMILK